MEERTEVPGDFDADRFRICSPVTAGVKQPDRQVGRKLQGRAAHLQGPVPMRWMAQAAQLPGKAVTVGVVLWFLATQAGNGGRAPASRSAWFPLQPEWLRQLGVQRQAGYRALRGLEQAGLIRVERRTGRAPLVRLIVPADAP
jgi:hypothetical protein